MGLFILVKKIFDWIKKHNIYSKKTYKKHGTFKKWLAISITAFLLLIITAVISAVVFANYYINSMLSKIERPDTEIDPGITAPKDETEADGVYNIMLYGIDSTDLNEISRSDAIMLVTINQKDKSVKMTSIARDSLVTIPTYGQDKLNHAFAHGWARKGNIAGGAELSIQTINYNFGLTVDEYVTINFWALSHIIDYVGGVYVDVDQKEMQQINLSSHYYTNTWGLNCPVLEKPGYQKLTGGQALAYSRIRKIDSDDMRTFRQREVLMSMFSSAKELNPLKYGELIGMFLEECTSSFTNEELLKLGSWAFTNIKNLKFDMLGIPTSALYNSKMIDGVWYNAYDVNKAGQVIREFLAKPVADTPTQE